ncbi:MAG TPA: cysteine desulfurase family protein [bacterium]|jgi:cysteine desulfurase
MLKETVAYFDHASTTPVRKSAADAMEEFIRVSYGNPSSPHYLGRVTRKAIDKARDTVAECIGARSREVIFTGSGSEAIFLSVVGAAIGNQHRGKHVITSTFEHHATLGAFKFLEEQLGFEVKRVRIDPRGLIKMSELDASIRDDTILISTMFANNEIGTMQNITGFKQIIGDREIILHSDCVQGWGKFEMNVNDYPVDIACGAAHKFGGPKGVGFLYIKDGIHVESLQKGSHEFGMRSGTENVAGIVGAAVALEEAISELESNEEKLADYRKQLVEFLRSIAPDCTFNGIEEYSYPGTLNVTIPGVSGEMMVLALDREGVACSTGSACTTGSVGPSHVLTSMGLSLIDATSSLRLSLGYTTTQEEIDYFKSVFPEIYDRIKQS